MSTFRKLSIQPGLKFFYYPSVNIHEVHLDLSRHIKTIPTICLLHDYRKDFLFGQYQGDLFSNCYQVKIMPDRSSHSIGEVFNKLLVWSRENLPEDEIILIPASMAGAYSYWSNPDSAALAKLSLS